MGCSRGLVWGDKATVAPLLLFGKGLRTPAGRAFWPCCPPASSFNVMDERRKGPRRGGP